MCRVDSLTNAVTCLYNNLRLEIQYFVLSLQSAGIKEGLFCSLNAIHMQRYEKFPSAGKNFYDYIKNNSKADPKQLYLSAKGKNLGFPAEFAVTQIECRQKTARKLSAFLNRSEFLFPSTLAAEQSTHQCVASYHALIAGTGKTIADMTAGLGIDAFSFARGGNMVTAVELDHMRAEILKHNSEVLELHNVDVVEADCLKWMRSKKSGVFDILFIDPARRGSDSRRTYLFRDCLPDIVSNMAELRSFAPVMMVKASPILDISGIVREIDGVTSIHIACVRGECKESLIILDGSRPAGNPEIVTVDLEADDNAGVLIRSIWKTAFADLGGDCALADLQDLREGMFLYDPNAAVHKLNCQSALCKDFPDLKRLSANTDLYCSHVRYDSFPGRIFSISGILDKKSARSIQGSRCEVAVRNFPLTAEQLRKKLHVCSGDDSYIYGCSVGVRPKPVMLRCQRLQSGVGKPQTNLVRNLL